MPNDEMDDKTQYNVVMNHEEQYSIWPVGRGIPNGWHTAGKTGTKAECLSHIKEVWTGMRPASLRRQMEARNKPSVSEATGAVQSSH